MLVMEVRSYTAPWPAPKQAKRGVRHLLAQNWEAEWCVVLKMLNLQSPNVCSSHPEKEFKILILIFWHQN